MFNVLVIEDEFVIASDIKSIIDDMHGFKAYIASSMQSAIEISEKRCPDIIVSDIKIKGDTDGIDTVKFLQNIYKFPVIFLTSYNDKKTLQRASDINITGYLLKPFKEDELITLVNLCAMKISNTSALIEIAKGCIYHPKKQQVLLDDVNVNLTKKEYRLFLLLYNSRGKVVPFSSIDEVLWNDALVNDTSRRQLFYRLRKKLPTLSLKTVKFQGFILETTSNE